MKKAIPEYIHFTDHPIILESNLQKRKRMMKKMKCQNIN